MPCESPWRTEVLTALGIGLFGVLANFMVLGKKPAGITLGWIAFAFTIWSIGIGVWQGTINFNHFAGSQAARGGFVLGIGIVMLFRIVLLTLYGACLVQAKNSAVSTDEYADDYADQYASYAR